MVVFLNSQEIDQNSSFDKIKSKAILLPYEYKFKP